MPSRPRRRLGWIDLLVVAATSLTFATVVYSQQRHPPGRPTEETVQAIVTELGITADDFHRAVAQVPPPPRGVRPSDAERAERHRAFAAALSVPVSKLNAVMAKYPPPPRF